MGLIILLIVVFFISFFAGYFTCAFLMAGRMCGNFLIDNTNPNRTIYRVELTNDISSKYAMFEVKEVSGLESANDSNYILEQ